MRSRLAAAVLLSGLVVLAVPTAAQAATLDQVAAALRTSPLYEEPGATDLVDSSVLDTLGGSSPQVYVAVLKGSEVASSSVAVSDALALGRALRNSSAVVLVISDNRHFGAVEGNAARSSGVSGARALSTVLQADSGNGQAFDKDGVTALVNGFVEEVSNEASGSGSGADGTGGTSTVGSGTSTSSNTGAYVVGGIALLAVAGIGSTVVSGRRRRLRLNEGLRAEVQQLYDRLGNDVSTIDPHGDQVAGQSLADAAERYNASGATLATADAPAEFAAARRSAIEGLTAARAARVRLGLDPGPEIPPAIASAEVMQVPQTVQVGDQSYAGTPGYAPGNRHWFGGGMLGGSMVPGGWYATPFWEPFLLGSVLSGGFGGGFGGFGGGYDRGYGSGYDQGYDAGRDSGGGSGWSGGGGGTWGGGGGAGGGDWGGGGGGGGDWGGGGGGGGDSGGGGTF